MQLKITQQELRKAQDSLRIAVERGFIVSEAVYKADCLDEYGNLFLKFETLCEKAHPTDGHQNWGCQGASSHYRVANGKLVALDEPKRPQAQFWPCKKCGNCYCAFEQFAPPFQDGLCPVCGDDM